MRMDRLLADLEAAEAARRAAQMRLDVAEGVRAERASVCLVDRLRAGIAARVEIVVSGHPVRGLLTEVGHGWVTIDRSARGAPVMGMDDLVQAGVVVVSVDAIEGVSGLGPAHSPGEDSPVGRTWGALLRAVARSRTTVVWRCRSGQRHTGIIDAVGVDHVVLRRAAGGPLMVATQEVACVEIGARRGEDYA